MNRTELEKIKVHSGRTVKEAMKQMDKTGLKILFVIDNNDKLAGTITDGDFRKWILAGKSLDGDISGLYNKSPMKFSEGYNLNKVKQLLVEKRIEAVPIVDKDQKLSDALFWEELFGKRDEKILKTLDVPVAIIAGGEGKRLSPFTKIVPKPLIPFGEKPVIEVIMDNFSAVGCTKFYFLLGYKGAMIQSYFENVDNGYSPVYKFENEPSGTAGSLKLLVKENLPDSFFVSNCDIVIKADYADVFEFHNNQSADITIVSAMRHFVVPYGVIEMTPGGEMNKLTEKPEYDFLVNTGMYILKKHVLSMIPGKGIFHLTDLIKIIQQKSGKISIYPISEKSWFDIGQLELWQESTAMLDEEKVKL